MTADLHPQRREQIDRERSRFVRQLAAMLDRPMTVLAFVWIGLLIIDMTHGLTGWLDALNYVIWGIFIVHFLVEFLLAPYRKAYLRRNWLTAVSLLLPALRVLRVFRAFRVLRGARAVRSAGLMRLLTSLNRGINAVRRSMRRRGLGYVAMTTLLAVFAGAAGMYFFENPSALREAGYSHVADRGGGFDTYGDAVWWTAMTITTMGADYFPKTAEGRLLCWVLALYAFAVFGYITASIASFFIDADRRSPAGGSEAKSVAAEVAALRSQVAALMQELRERSSGV
jgi:voltage-gated potassium channel